MSNGVGSHLRFIPNSADQDEFNINLNRAHDGLGPVTPQATAEQIKQLVEEAQAADETRAVNRQNANEFCALHPEFLDNEKNGAQFNKTLDAMFGANIAYTVDQFERAYAVCRANNSLELDQTEIVKQEQAAANAQRKAVTKQRQERNHLRNLSAEELDTLPLEKLREIYDREAASEMQKAGERGGNGW